MDRTAAITDRLRQAGDHQSGEIALPLGITSIGLSVARKNWRATVGNAIDAQVEVSADRQLWIPAGGVTSKADEKYNKNGTPWSETTLLCPIPVNFKEVAQLYARIRMRQFERCEGIVELLTGTKEQRAERGPIHNSVTYDNDKASTATAATGLNITSFTVANQANRCLLYGMASWDATAGDSAVSSVAYNSSGTGSASVITELGPGGAIDRATIFRQIAPAVATATAAFTMGGTCSEMYGIVMSAYNVDQTTPVGTGISGEGSGTVTPSVTVASVNATDLLFDVMYDDDAADRAVGANQTKLNGAAGFGKGLSSRQSGADGGVMSWANGSYFEYVQVAVALKEAAGGGGGPSPHPLAGRSLYSALLGGPVV